MCVVFLGSRINDHPVYTERLYQHFEEDGVHIGGLLLGGGGGSKWLGLWPCTWLWSQDFPCYLLHLALQHSMPLCTNQCHILAFSVPTYRRLVFKCG